MSLVSRQIQFQQNVTKLFEYIQTQTDFKITLGEAYRTIDQQRIYIKQGRSKTMRSKHLQRLAIDLNFFYIDQNNKYQLTYDKQKLQHIGDFWESLAPQNQWGGNWKSFKDVPHFQG